MSEYRGWTLYDKVKIVIKNVCTYNYKHPQAYVVDPANKKQIESAIRWAGTKHTVIDTNNGGFKLTILDCAGNSSQGGKLSFWNCLIEKEEDNIKCIIGINANLLVKLLKSTSFFNGECAEEIYLARCMGEVGALTVNMQEYKDALNDMQEKKKANTGKTKKWQVGCNYKTLTIDSLYLGKINKFIKIDRDTQANRYMYKAVTDNEKEHNICCMTSTILNNNITKMSRLVHMWRKYIRNTTDELIKDKVSNSGRVIRVYKLFSEVPLFYNSTMGSKLPARQQGEVSIEIDVDLTKAYKEIIELMQESLIKLHKVGVNIDSFIGDVLIRVNDNTLNNPSDSELYLLQILEHSNYIDTSKIKIPNGDNLDNTKTRERLLAQYKKFLESVNKEETTCKK